MPHQRPTPQRSAFKNSTLNLIAGESAIRILLLLALCATYFVYVATTKFQFVYDDRAQILYNVRVHSTRFFPQYFTQAVWAQPQGLPENYYRPLFLCWLLGNFNFFGISPTGWHFTSILLHLAVSLMVYLLGRRLIPGSRFAGLVAAVVFALHPSHVEAVAWASGVMELLMSLFFVGSFLCYLEQRRGKRRILWLAASLALCAAAVLSKETAVVLPVVIVCYELLLPQANNGSDGEASAERRRRLFSLVKAVSPYLVLIAGYFLVRITVLHGVAHRVAEGSIGVTVLTWPWALYFYLSQLLAPGGLGLFYDVQYATGFSWRLLILPLVVLSATGCLLYWWVREAKTRLPIFFSAWFLVSLAPMIGVVTVMSRHDAVHDRYVYLPSVGFALLAGYAASAAIERLTVGRPAAVFATVAILIVLGLATRNQVLSWRNSMTLYARAVNTGPNNLFAKLNLSSEMIRFGQNEDAFVVAKDAVALEPRSALAISGVAKAAYLTKNYPLAEQYYLEALALAPPRIEELYYLGMERIKTGRYKEALSVLRQGNTLWPNSPGYHAAMAKALEGMGEWQEARREYLLEATYYPNTPGGVLARVQAERATPPQTSTP
jgi:tetratricopeptide (TPR) repeat protein